MPQRLPDSWQVAFALIEVNGPGSSGARFGDPAERREDVRQVEQDVGVLAEEVRLCGEGSRRAREFLGFAMTAAVGQYSCQNSLAERWGDEVFTGRGFLAHRDQANGFVIPALTLRRDSSGQFRRGGGQVAPLTHLVQGAVFEAKVLLRGRWIAGEHCDESSRLGDRRRYRGTERVQDAFRAVERRLCCRNIVPHRVQACQIMKDNRPSEGVISDLIEIGLTSPDPFLRRSWTPECG